MCPAWRLSKEGQTDSQVGWQVTKIRKFHAYHWLMRFYNNRLLAINLCRLALGGQTVKNLCLLVSKFELDQSQRKSTQVCRKSIQVDASVWPNEMQVEPKSKTCVALWVCLARALGLRWSCEFLVIHELYFQYKKPFVAIFQLLVHLCLFMLRLLMVTRLSCGDCYRKVSEGNRE